MSTLARAQQLHARFGDVIAPPVEFRGEVSLTVRESDRIAEVCACAKHDLGFDFIVDVSSVDHFGDDPRFELVYELYSHQHHVHLRLKTKVGEGKAELPSVSSVWKGAEWHEREIYDMMGIRFSGHPDLRRLIMWEGYPYHPLRKDFPVTGKPTEVPEVAFTETAPIEGGPFVTLAGGKDATQREPRVRNPES